MITTISIYILLTILIAWFSILVLHFLVYLFFEIREEHEIDPDTGEEVPTYHYAYSSLSLRFLWMDIIPNKVIFHPIKSLKMLCKFFYTGYLKKKWEWLSKNTWLGEKIYLYFLKRKGFKMLKELEKSLKQKSK